MMLVGPARRLLSEDRGAAAVEFALVFPLTLIFILGIWYMGWAFNCSSEAGHAVELGSRIYVSNPSATQAQLTTAVASHLTDISINDMTMSSSAKTVGSATMEHVAWTYSTTPPIPFISAITLNFGGSVDVPLATP
jgi:Flp pilus assembly protein TadG